jgi:hypothetical protein
MLDPAPERIEAAREALDLLASLTRVEVLDQMKKRAGREAARTKLRWLGAGAAQPMRPFVVSTTRLPRNRSRSVR